ncbi:MAG: hypothetical protein HY598_01525 [Candidatus Omnitrophica bacterium]|nr:hypothetical protein [Candidatus Omnitrophota bacterium]
MRAARGLGVLLGAALGFAPAPLAAEPVPAEASSTVIKKKDGLRFNVPPDWPVEERNGAVGPIPIEEYLGRKFSSLESRLRVLEQQISSFELRLRVLEEEGKRSSRSGGGLRSGEQ